MKRILLGALLSVGLTACQTSEERVAPRYSLSFEAAAEPYAKSCCGAEIADSETTRTTFEGQRLVWRDRDELTFYWDDPADPAYATGRLDAETGRIRFDATLTAPKTLPLVFFYPYSAEGSVNIPAIQQQAQYGTFEGKYNPMLSANIADDRVVQDGTQYALSGVIGMYPMAAVLRVRITTEDAAIQKERIRSVRFETGTGTMLAGENRRAIADRLTHPDFPRDVDLTKGLTKSSTTAEVRITADEEIGAGRNDDRAIFLAIIPGVHRGRIIVTTNQNEYIFPTGMAINFERGHVQPLALALEPVIPAYFDNFRPLSSLAQLAVEHDLGLISKTELLIVDRTATQAMAHTEGVATAEEVASPVIRGVGIERNREGEFTPEAVARSGAEVFTLGWDVGTDAASVKYAGYSLLTDALTAAHARLMVSAGDGSGVARLFKGKIPYAFEFNALASGNAI